MIVEPTQCFEDVAGLKHPAMFSRTQQITKDVLYRRCFGIGGIISELTGRSEQDFCAGIYLGPFQVEERAAQIVIQVEWTDELALQDFQPIFKSGATWNLFEAEPGLVFEFTSSATGKLPYK